MKAKRLALLAALTAIALTVFAVEAQLPPLAPIPGIKLGLANIVTVWALFALGPLDALLILLGRILLGSLFAGQAVSLLYSLAGGLLCFAVCWGLRRVLTERQLWAASVFGALAHNTGQLLAAWALTRTAALWAYFPVLGVSATLTGAFTGLAAQMVYRRLKNAKFLREKE